jgi:hypothetical protein
VTSPLTLLGKNELQTAMLLLNHAATSARWVSMLFQKAGDNEGAARMMDTLKRLADEAKALHGVIAQARDEGHA